MTFLATGEFIVMQHALKAFKSARSNGYLNWRNCARIPP